MITRRRAVGIAAAATLAPAFVGWVFAQPSPPQT